MAKNQNFLARSGFSSPLESLCKTSRGSRRCRSCRYAGRHGQTPTRSSADQPPLSRLTWSSITPFKSINSATPKLFTDNVALEMHRNQERYQFLPLGATIRSIARSPSRHRICHQVNLEYLAKVVWSNNNPRKTVLYPDTVVEPTATPHDQRTRCPRLGRRRHRSGGGDAWPRLFDGAS